MSKSSNFFGQPIYGQLIKSLNRDKIVEILAETDGDIQAAIEIIRKKGQAVAAKREDRNAAEGCVFAGSCGNFAAIATLKCETDFVAKNDSFRALAKKIPRTRPQRKGKEP